MKRLTCLGLMLFLLLTACGQGARFSEDGSSAERPSWQEQYDLGLRYLAEGNYAEAIIAFTAAIEIDPKQAPAYVGRGDAHIGVALLSVEDTNGLTGGAKSSYQSALEDYLYAIGLDESNVDVYLKTADTYIALGNIDDAGEILRRGFEATGSDILSHRIEEVTSEANEETTPEAEPSGDKMAIEVTGSIPLSNVSYSYEEGGQLSENYVDFGAIGEIRLFYTVDGPAGVNVGIFTLDEHGSYGLENADVVVNNAIQLWKENGVAAVAREIPFRVNGMSCPILPKDKGTIQDIFLVGFNEQMQAMGYAIVTVEIP